MTTVTGIVKGGQLIPEEQWRKFIASLTPNPDDLETNKERSKRAIARLLAEAVKKRLKEKNAVLFSGGVDSSLIAFIIRKLGKEPLCYTVGMEGSDDLAWAQKSAQLHGFALRHKTITLEELETIMGKVIAITGSRDIITVGVGAVTYAGCAMAKRENHSAVFTGLGSEELFAGYERHAKALEQGFDAVHGECLAGLANMRQRDMVRDVAIASHFGMELLLPFLDKDVMKESLSIHPMHKISGEEKKIILREAAESMGMSRDIARRKKQAAQYGSNIINGIDKLAKRKGFSLKKDYLESL
ncbi:TPA: asparagine synthase [Candidatus Woesearchaeota archaeon]|nr:asparagine synthase [Candidatus Woesearchaeota archaeon]